MPYYHVTVSYVSKVTGLLERVGVYDLSEEALRKLLVEPYMDGKPFLLVGRPIDPFHVDEIHIYETKASAKRIFEEAQRKPFSHVRSIDEVVSEIFDGRLGKYVTHKFISSVPLRRKTRRFGKNVFIVHGRDTKPLKELKAMLLEFGLNPIVLHEQPSGSMTIIEKLERYSRDVGFAFVILSPDDALVPTTPYIEVNKKRGTIRPVYFYHMKPIFRARQNVIFEFGFFIAKIGRNRVCCLYKVDTELPYDMPSDIHGIVYIPFKESVNECRDKIIKELKAVGYKIKD
jgi:predicted nucleotide-binding protein